MTQRESNIEQRKLAKVAPGLILRNAELEISIGQLRKHNDELKKRNEELEGVIDLQRAKLRRYTNEHT